MKTLLVGYDLNKPGKNYDALIDRLKEHGTWWHNLDSTWLVRTNLTVVELRDVLADLIDSSDELLVVDVTGDAAAWAGFKKTASEWLLKHL
jgi:hypothetical protein